MICKKTDVLKAQEVGCDNVGSDGAWGTTLEKTFKGGFPNEVALDVCLQPKW